MTIITSCCPDCKNINWSLESPVMLLGLEYYLFKCTYCNLRYGFNRIVAPEIQIERIGDNHNDNTGLTITGMQAGMEWERRKG